MKLEKKKGFEVCKRETHKLGEASSRETVDQSQGGGKEEKRLLSCKKDGFKLREEKGGSGGSNVPPLRPS